MTARDRTVLRSFLGDDAPRARLLPRFLAFGLVVAIVTGVLAVRLFHLQVARGGYYTALADDNRVALEPVRSTRGLILDRTGRALVRNVPSFAVKVRPADLPVERRQDVARRLASLLGMSVADVLEAIDKDRGSRFDLVRIATDVPEDVARLLSEERGRLPGVEVSVEARRSYPYGPLVSHVVGYTAGISGDEYRLRRDEGYLLDDTLGRGGVESTYEADLRGRYGVDQVERDAAGRQLRVVSTLREPRAGNTLELTLDVETQREAEQSLRWAMELAGMERGVVIVMDPQTGEVHAMVSLPSYDNNLFATGISSEDFQALLHDENKPLRNTAISEVFPPGSTYKLVTGAGALADGKITPRTKVRTAAYLPMGRYRFWEWNRRGWGPLDIYDGFGHSSDTFFYQVAGMLGIDRLAYWARQWGFDAETGIDLPAEATGSIPTNEWKERIFGEPIYPGEVYQAGIGQGYNTVTPIQLINAYAALANGGRLLEPQVVRRVISPDGAVVRGFEPRLIRELPIDDEVLRVMREASRRVVTIRHTYNLVELPIVVAGKSGTAEFGIRDSEGRLPFHSWFAAFVPAFDDPSKPDMSGDPARTDSGLVALAFAYDSRTKGNVATEIVKYFLQLHYDLDVDLRNFDYVKRGNFYGNQGN